MTDDDNQSDDRNDDQSDDVRVRDLDYSEQKQEAMDTIEYGVHDALFLVTSTKATQDGSADFEVTFGSNKNTLNDKDQMLCLFGMLLMHFEAVTDITSAPPDKLAGYLAANADVGELEKFQVGYRD